MAERDELVRKAAEELCVAHTPKGEKPLIRLARSSDPRLTIAACFRCQRQADAVLPLIEADLRERLAAEIEAEGRKEVQWLADTRSDATDMGRLIGTEDAYKDAIRIVRGATADTDPAGDNTTERT